MPEGNVIVAPPPEIAEPLWQPAQVFVAGEVTLLDVKEGSAKATGA